MPLRLEISHFEFIILTDSLLRDMLSYSHINLVFSTLKYVTVQTLNFEQDGLH